MECGNGKENMLRRESIEKRMKRRAGKAGRFFMLLLVSASLGGCKPKSQEPQWLDENATFTGESAMDHGQIPEGTNPEASSAAVEVPLSGSLQESGTLPQTGTVQETVEEPKELYVHVCGAVENPGVYVLPEGSRVVDAVTAAGGALTEACEEALNQALAVTDGMQVYVPTQEEAEESREWMHTGDVSGQSGSADGGMLSAGTGSEGKVNINTADVNQLCTLPGIGESRAASIVAYREEQGAFSAVEDIMKVSGIKDAAFAKIKDKICVK